MFSYGIFQCERTRMSYLNRNILVTKGTLQGWTRRQEWGPAFILPDKKDSIKGSILHDLTEQEWNTIDAVERCYHKITVNVEGEDCHAYIPRMEVSYVFSGRTAMQRDYALWKDLRKFIEANIKKVA